MSVSDNNIASFMFKLKKEHHILPSMVLARYCFKEEMIPFEDIYLDVPSSQWVIKDVESDIIMPLDHEIFIEWYMPNDKRASNYLDFIVDSRVAEFIPSPIGEFTDTDIYLEDDIYSNLSLASFLGLHGQIESEDNNVRLVLSHNPRQKKYSLMDKIKIFKHLMNNNFIFENVIVTPE
jgi:hypothetical protein